MLLKKLATQPTHNFYVIPELCRFYLSCLALVFFVIKGFLKFFIFDNLYYFLLLLIYIIVLHSCFAQSDSQVISTHPSVKTFRITCRIKICTFSKKQTLADCRRLFFFFNHPLSHSCYVRLLTYIPVVWRVILFLLYQNMYQATNSCNHL